MSFAGLHVGLIGPVPPPSGGMANQTRQLGRLLREAEAEVTMVATNAPYRPAFVANWRGLRAGFRLIAYLLDLWRAASRADVFHLMANSGWSWHLFAVPALVIGKLRGVPVVVNYRGGGAGEFLARSQRSVRFAMRRAAALIVPSGFLVDVFGRFGMQAEIVPNIIDLALFRARPPREGDSAHLVVTRNLEALYDNASAIRALAILRQRWPHARLTIAGSGPEEGALRALVAELGLGDAVHFAGILDRAGVAALYQEADLLLNPSLADNMPNSVLEAMASGVPVVSTAVGGVPYMLREGETGLLVPPQQPEALAAAAARVLGEDALWQKLSTTALAEVQRYTWPQVAGRLAATYAKARA